MNDKTSSAQSGGIAQGDNSHDNIDVTGGVSGDVVRGNKTTTIINEAAKPGVTALHQIQAPPADFVGREAEIKELMEMLEHGGVTISGLQGLGGVGKTTLALKLAEALKGKYSDAQFYLDLKGADEKPLPAADALAHVIRAYHPTAKLPESVDDLRALYLSVLHGQRVLLLMDNARDEHQVEPLIPPPECLLMVTSRFHFTVPGLKVKNLDALLPEDAVKLLLEIAPRIGDQATEIARLCGNLPLGLRLAASFLTTRANFKVAEYVRKLSDATERLKLIDASLSLSYELLRPELQANWRALAVFPDSFDQRAAAAVWDLDEEQTQERLGDLLNFSLVEWSEETDRYRLHDLARVFADSRLDKAERLTYQQRHAEHFLQVLTEADQLYLKGGEAVKAGLALFDGEWSNAQVGWAWSKDHAETIPIAQKLCSRYPDRCRYIAEIRRSPRELITWREIALFAAQSEGSKSEQVAHLSHLGIAFQKLGEFRRAINFYEQTLLICRETNNLEGEGQSLALLGAAYCESGELLRAIESIKQALSILRQVGDRRDEGHLLNNLGNTYWRLNELQYAIEFFEQALSIYRENGDRTNEASTIGNLGAVYLDLGETNRGNKLLSQHLAIAREIGDRRSEGTALWNIAVTLKQLGSNAQAIANAEAAMVIYEQLEDPWAFIVFEHLEKWRGE